MADQGGVSASDLYGIYNMGVGMALVTRPENADAVVALARSNGKQAQVIGTVTADAGTVRITANGFTPVDLVNDGKTFQSV
jgi:phosphoribosylformylglycinamidine cyclo-ligase